jgi:hypothetical protein
MEEQVHLLLHNLLVTGGFSSWITFNRNSKAGVVILSNYADRDRDIDSIGVDIMQFILEGKIDFVSNS